MTDTKSLPIPSADKIHKEHATVIVVGAGPVGLFLALKLAIKGVDVLVLEAEPTVLQSPRATTYMPIVLNEMEKVGLADDVIREGHKNKEGISFRESHAKGGKILGALKMAQVPKGHVKYDFVGVHMGQHDLAELILRHCGRCPSFRIRWQHRFVGVQQSSHDKPMDVAVVSPKGEHFFSCDYLVGADGAGSAVRRSQCIPFEGFTWNDFRFVASNVKYDFEKYGFTTANMIMDEEDWAVIARTGPGDQPWRVAFGVRTDVPESEILKQLPSKYERLLPGPRPLQYELVSANPYWAHQRCAKSWKVGNIVLCGDAGHSNNPVGGLGLTTGFLDAAALGNCLVRILVNGEEGNSLLQRYAEVRRSAWLDYTCNASIEFKLRLHSTDPEVVANREAWLHSLNTDPDIHKKAASMMNSSIEDMFEVPDPSSDESSKSREAAPESVSVTA